MRKLFVILALAAVSCTKIEYREVIKEVIKEVEVEKEVIVEVHDTLYIERTDDTLYSWEQGRYKAPAISDMVLCYGGSPIRKSTDWPESRFKEYVSYTDQEGKEHWLFDSFLALEWRDIDTNVFDKEDIGNLWAEGAYGLTGGHDYHSARKDGWQRQLDFWFTAEDNGFNGLDKAIESAAQRMGEPSCKRRVVMFLPDPIPTEVYSDPNSSSVYWGSVDGKELDFSKDEDRLLAYKWYIDSARALFNERAYKHIELIGFYILSEDMKHPSESYTDYAKLYNCIRPLADYLHSFNEYLYWIPYNKAPGKNRGWDLGIDYIWLQPNYYEHGGSYLSSAMSSIIDNGVGMEIEFDRKAFFRYDGQYDANTYSIRLKSYLSSAKKVYGERPFTYYIMTDWTEDVMMLFRTSIYTRDKELYHEFCQFVIGNPLREKLK